VRLGVGVVSQGPVEKREGVRDLLGCGMVRDVDHPPALSAGSPIPDFFLLEAWIWSLNSIFSS